MAAKKRAPASSEERIEHIAGMMRRLEWRRGESSHPLAKEWGLSEVRVRNLSAEASRRVRAELSDGEKDHAAALSAVALDRVVHDALDDAETARASERPAEAAPHRRTAIEALRELRELTGAGAPQRVEVDLTAMPAEKLETMLADAVKVLNGKGGRG